MYVWSSHTARVWTNEVRLPILLVVSLTGKMNIPLSAFAPENLVSRERRVRQSRPASACSFSILRLNLVLTHGIPPDFRGGVHFVIGGLGNVGCSTVNCPIARN